MIVLEYLREFQGIIGALAGVVVTLIVSHFIKNSGTVKIHSQGLKYTSYTDDSNGLDSIGRTLGGRYIAFELQGVILFENTSESTKAIHNIRLEFLTNNNTKEQEIQDSSTIKKVAGGISFDTITHLNILPKEIIAIEARMRSNPALLGYRRDQSRVFLSYDIADKKIIKNKRNKMNII